MRDVRIPQFAALAIALAAMHRHFPTRHFVPLVPSARASRTAAVSKLRIDAAKAKRARRCARNLEWEKAR